MKSIILTIDVEEWWSVYSFRNLNLKENSDYLDDRIEVSVNILLRILEQFKIKATFFVLGRVAEKYPEIIRKISINGHEIGTHGFGHNPIYHQSEKEFEEDLIKSITILESITGKKVIFYRAPSYSITNQTLWALEILKKNGIRIDSSIVPTLNSRFGIKNSPQEPYIIELLHKNSQIIEFPPNVINIFNKCIPISSGFAFRMFPQVIIDRYFEKCNKFGNKPMIIIHNWEVDINHPRVNPGIKGSLIHYYNLKNVISKLLFFFSKYNISGLPLNLEISKRVSLNDLK